MSKARQNLTRRIKALALDGTREAEVMRLVARLSDKVRKRLGLPAPAVRL